MSTSFALTCVVLLCVVILVAIALSTRGGPPDDPVDEYPGGDDPSRDTDMAA